MNKKNRGGWRTGWAIFGEVGGPFMDTLSETRAGAIEKFCLLPSGERTPWKDYQKMGRVARKITIMWGK